MKTIDTETLLQIGIALSADDDIAHLLQRILDTAMNLTGCDAGILYIRKDDTLRFYLSHQKGLLKDAPPDASFDLPLDPQLDPSLDSHELTQPLGLPSISLQQNHICAWVAVQKMLVNISDVYHMLKADNDWLPSFDFSDVRRYDATTGYHTKSMLIVPMLDKEQETVGVIQCINALDENGHIVSFAPECEQILLCLASQCAILLANLNYRKEITDLLQSFVQVMSIAIDARTPYNANHTRNMASYAQVFLKWLRDVGHPRQMSQKDENQFLMAVWLHDIGKLIIPLHIMNKSTRLGNKLSDVEHRFQIIGLLDQLALAKGECTPQEFRARTKQRERALHTVRKANTVGYLSDEQLATLQEIRQWQYTSETGEKLPWLTADELHSLSVRSGTLTQEEREIMNSHVTLTSRMLDTMAFSRGYHNVPLWAGAHHEFLNGTGYPNHLKGDEIPWEVRLLTLLDIFEALTARDRPYKSPMPVGKALTILNDMVKQGQLDGDIVQLFTESRAWERVDTHGTAFTQ